MKLEDCIYFLTTRLSRELRKKFDEFLTDIDITASGWCVLMTIIENNENITQREIAEILSLETPTVTRILDLLQKKGFIKREPHPEDRRCFIVKLTEKGRKITNDIIRYGECFMSCVTNLLNENDLKLFKEILKKLYFDIKNVNISSIISCQN